MCTKCTKRQSSEYMVHVAASYASQLGVGKTAPNELTHTEDGNIKGNKRQVQQLHFGRP